LDESNARIDVAPVKLTEGIFRFPEFNGLSRET
jgi:hypothetical protein